MSIIIPYYPLLIPFIADPWNCLLGADRAERLMFGAWRPLDVSVVVM